MIAGIIAAFDADATEGRTSIRQALLDYGGIIGSWAEAAARRMIAEVIARDEAAWIRTGRNMGVALKQEIAGARTGEAMRKVLAEQVGLIKSLPLQAAQRVHELAIKGIEEGARASAIGAEIMRISDVTAARANLIARTEVARTASVLTQVRAQHIGSAGYIWRTAADSDVRPSHRAMSGKFVAWETPPTLDGLVGHAGCLPNCRCYPEPVIPEDRISF